MLRSSAGHVEHLPDVTVGDLLVEKVGYGVDEVDRLLAPHQRLFQTVRQKGQGKAVLVATDAQSL